MCINLVLSIGKSVPREKYKYEISKIHNRSVKKKKRGKQNANVVQKGSDNSHSSIWEDLKDGLHRWSDSWAWQ